MTQKIIAWDFDGVLNRNLIDGTFVWKATFDRDIGVSAEAFSKYVFRSGRFDDVLIGKRDLIDLVAEWIEQADCAITPTAFLNYWFGKDNLPDDQTIQLLNEARTAGFINVLATNNEARRLAYIRNEMKFETRMDHFFAAGPIGHKKPEEPFFRMIECALGARGEDLFLIDDKAENVEAAKALGWHAFHFQAGDHNRLAEAIRDFGAGA